MYNITYVVQNTYIIVYMEIWCGNKWTCCLNIWIGISLRISYVAKFHWFFHRRSNNYSVLSLALMLLKINRKLKRKILRIFFIQQAIKVQILCCVNCWCTLSRHKTGMPIIYVNMQIGIMCIMTNFYTFIFSLSLSLSFFHTHK